MNDRNCPDCGDKMIEYDFPIDTVLFRIPIIKIEIIWRNPFGKEWFCNACACDKANEPFHRAYQAGKEDGYLKGIQDN